MSESIRQQSEHIREFVFRHLDERSLASKIVSRFGISRQAANSHLRRLVKEGALQATGLTTSRTYRLTKTSEVFFHYTITPQLEEDTVWKRDIRPLLEKLPANVMNIWHWAFTEMFNNAIDHSAGQKITVRVTGTAVSTEIFVRDNGIGIFKKIQEECHLDDERHAVFELSKGKLTTDAKRHSGQGIFFTSRMVNKFQILSHGVYFDHDFGDDTDWVMDSDYDADGTLVIMKVDNHTSRTTKKILDKYSVKGSYGFNKTVVPLEMARYGTDQLISRSQAKRVLTRVDQFAQAILDFEGIDEIGQAFADEIFRVFVAAHPSIELLPINLKPPVSKMIKAAQKQLREDRRIRNSAKARS